VALEGGYNEEMTAMCAEAVIRVMLGEAPRDLSGPQRLKACTEDAIRKALAVQVGELLLTTPTVTMHARTLPVGEAGERGRRTHASAQVLPEREILLAGTFTQPRSTDA
jgi:hypothetical protein